MNGPLSIGMFVNPSVHEDAVIVTLKSCFLLTVEDAKRSLMLCVAIT